MRKIVFLFVLLSSGLWSVAQLRVANNFGRDLYVSVDGKEAFINNKGVKTFATRPRTAYLECRTTDNLKFSITKEVSRAGLVTITPDDYSNTVSAVSTINPVTTYEVQSNSNEASLDEMLSSGGSPVNYSTPVVTNQTVITKQTVSTPATVVKTVVSEQIKFVYTGSSRFKIFSAVGRGLEFLGTDTTEVDNAKNEYSLMVPKNEDLIIGIGLKTSTEQAIWPYAEIRKRVNVGDGQVIITQRDLKKMSTSENKKLRIRLMAQNYKIFFEPDASDPISIGYREISRAIEVPVGQFYIRVSYTDPRGKFNRTVFVPKHVTATDTYLEITKSDLDNAVVLDW
jgi:hypothetical protein